MEIFKEEFFASERVQAIEGNKNSNSEETDYFTRYHLLNNSGKSNKKYEKNIKYNSTLKVCVCCCRKSRITTRCNTRFFL